MNTKNKTPHEALSEVQLNEIQERIKKATLGPWVSFVESRDHFSGSDFIRTAGEDIYLNGATVDDQEFIAHARQDIPMLIQELKRLKALLERRS